MEPASADQSMNSRNAPRSPDAEIAGAPRSAKKRDEGCRIMIFFF